MNSAGFNRNTPVNPAEILSRRWQELLKIYLPVGEKNSIWRYSRLREPADPEQGWKLHVSATILNACEILEIVAAFLKSRKVFYKAPLSLYELKKLNAGIYYDYTQIGKFLTIYPQTDKQSVHLAEKLYQLTAKFSAPSIPFETRFKPDGCVYYRYGAFKINVLKDENGGGVLAMRDGKGELIPDLRDANEAHPTWISNPFPVEKKLLSTNDSPLKTRFKIYRALSQRGKGGVYQGFDLSVAPPRLCLIKEGRRNGETEWNGRDGFWRVKHEASVLEILRAAEINVPRIYSSFEAENNFYLATEFIEGENLHVYLKKRRRRLKISRAVELAIQLAGIIVKIHAAGWLWRDCKPANLMLTAKGELRPLDFEGACLIEEPDYVSWSTLTTGAENRDEAAYNQTSEAVDLYALGAIIYLLFEGELPAADAKNIKRMARKNVPPEIKSLIIKLLNAPLDKNLNADKVEKMLKQEQKNLAAVRA